jgi:hypothetical protein
MRDEVFVENLDLTTSKARRALAAKVKHEQDIPDGMVIDELLKWVKTRALGEGSTAK